MLITVSHALQKHSCSAFVTVFPSFFYCSNPFADLYSLSYLWFSTLTFVTTTVVGLTASLLLGNFCPDFDLLIND